MLLSEPLDHTVSGRIFGAQLTCLFIAPTRGCPTRLMVRGQHQETGPIALNRERLGQQRIFGGRERVELKISGLVADER